MDPLEILTKYGPLIMTALAPVLILGVRRALGRVEGTIGPWAERLQRHSDNFRRIDVALVRLENLPRVLQEWRSQAKQEYEALDSKLERLAEIWTTGVGSEAKRK